MFDLSQCQDFIFLVAWQFLNRRCRGNEFDCVGLADDFADVLSFEVLFADVARLVVEKAVGVAHPRHASEENSRNKDDTNRGESQKLQMRQEEDLLLILGQR